MVFMVSAVLTGKVLFSTTTVCFLAYFDIVLAEDSIHFKSLAKPAPIPFSLVGVLTEINIISASEILFQLYSKKEINSSVFF